MQAQRVARVGRILREPPRIIVRRVLTELSAQTDRFRAPRRARRFGNDALVASTDAASTVAFTPS